jgi:hypothetical protein
MEGGGDTHGESKVMTVIILHFMSSYTFLSRISMKHFPNFSVSP